ncbi:hypothetical protein [Streptomyces lavendofoliae]|uniref:Uncharacterized protein n=1 Tax=Streptomyces lavendofoliae TaxID=67314 RepID=A0A918I2C8_9ACTN|nr:hypothetical protein [Streptomyces lavendofoliae]GGU52161.1 hypothetical protein GCM10010274_46330 [Streptomyces lavendofoliae]
MSIAQDLRTRARHRGLTPWQLIQKIGRLEREADSTACQLVAMATEIDGLRRERNELEAQLDDAGIDLSGALEDLRAAEVELRELRAFKANTTAVSAPASTRDIDPGDQPTAPVPLWKAPIAGPVQPVRDPGHVPSWANPAA